MTCTVSDENDKSLELVTVEDLSIPVEVAEEDLNEENFRDIRSTIAYLSTLGSPRFAAAGDERIRVEL